MYSQVEEAGYKICEGYIENKRGKRLNPPLDKDGYPRASLYISGRYKNFHVHRLVAWKFVPNPEGKPCVNHKDGDRSNPHPSNLEWVTSQENNLHARDGITRDGAALVAKAKELRAQGLSTYAIAKAIGVDQKAAWSYVTKE